MKKFFGKYGMSICIIIAGTALIVSLDIDFARIVAERGGWESYKQSNFLWENVVCMGVMFHIMYAAGMFIAGLCIYDEYNDK